MKNELRPIGTEFKIIRPPMENSTSTETTITKYRVVAHTKAMRFHGDEEGEMMEEIKAVDIRVKNDQTNS